MDWGAMAALALFTVGVIYSAGRVAGSVDNVKDEVKALREELLDFKEQSAQNDKRMTATLMDYGQRISWLEGRNKP